MPSLQSLVDKYPLISLASDQDQAKIFSVIDRTSLQSGGIQVGFDRRPDFFEVLKSQGHHYFVFLMHNEDGATHGLAVLSFRSMNKNGKAVSIGYASDLRTTRDLTKAAHIQWRHLYADIVRDLSQIPDFENAESIITAVWDSNTLAQRALVKRNPKLAVQYNVVDTYRVCSVIGRLRYKKPHKLGIRHLRSDETSVLEIFLCKSHSTNEFSWTMPELKRTLQQLGKGIEDFLVQEDTSGIQSICLPVDSVPGRKTKVLSLPKNLLWLTRLVKLLFGMEISLGQELKTKYLMFFRCRDSEQKYSRLSDFLHACFNTEKAKPKNLRTQVYICSLWNERSLSTELWKRGFIHSPISAKLYEVSPIDEKQELASHELNAEQLEVALL